MKKDNDDDVIRRPSKGKLVIAYDKTFLIISGKQRLYRCRMKTMDRNFINQM